MGAAEMYDWAMIRGRLLGLVMPCVIVAANACGEGVEPLSEQSGTLSPGSYIVKEFEPALSFEVDNGWEVSEGQQKPFFEILHEYRGGSYFVAVSFNNPPSKVSDPRNPNKRMPAPKDWVSWFQGHPYLETSSPQPATVGGVEGKRFDTRVSSPDDYYSEDCGGQGVPLWPLLRGHHWCADDGYTSQTIVLNDVQGETVIIDVWSPSRTFEKVLSTARDVLNTVEWERA
jgi:hypothetical protein